MKTLSHLKTNSKYWLALTLFTLPAFATPPDGSGVRDGGHIQDVNGKPGFRDRVTKEKCIELKRGSEVIQGEVGITKTLNKLKELDWYFGTDFEMELRLLNFCFTGRLKFLPPIDKADVLVVEESAEYKTVKQLGLRYDNTVYVDQSRLEDLSDYDREQFYIHEALHAYISMSDPFRRLHLYTASSAIMDVLPRGGQPTASTPDRDKLHYVFDQMAVDFPRTVEELEPFRAQVEYFISDSGRRKAMILDADSPEDLIQLDFDAVKPWLARWHQDEILLLAQFNDDLTQIMKKGSLIDFKKLITGKTFSQVNIIQLAISILPKLSKEKKEFILNCNQFETLGTDVFNWLNSIKPEYTGMRIRANSDLQSLGASNTSDVFMTIKPRREGESQRTLPTPIAALANATVTLIKNGNWDQVKILYAHSTSKPDFYSSFSLKSSKDAIKAMRVKFTVDQSDSLILVDQIAEGLRARFIAVIVNQLKKPEAIKFKTIIK